MNIINAFLYPILGGLLIGISAVILLLFSGRIAGVSGIFWRAVSQPTQSLWALAFVVGLPLGTWLFHAITAAPIPSQDPVFSHGILGGLLVGIGVKLGSGCTSGHGVCGIARLSVRSLVATCIFMTTGILTVFIVRHAL